MTLRIGDTAPDFEADTTSGRIKFHDWLGSAWGVLFSHPKDFTPVCTTELGALAKLKPEFDRRNVKVIGLSVDALKDHTGWTKDIEETQGAKLNYPLLADGDAFKSLVDRFVERYRGRVDTILGIESRGFLIGAAVAYGLGIGLAVARKPGKLPYETHSASYELEYGTDTLEVHRDAICPGARVLIVDDLIATGGTAAAAAALVTKLGAEVVEGAFVIELSFLSGRERFKPCNTFSLVQYESE